MLGFEPVPKPVCGITIVDSDGVTHTCVRAAPYWTNWHIHLDGAWYIHVPFTEAAFCWSLKAERKAALVTLTNARHQLDRNTIPEDHDELNDAVTQAEQDVLFGRWRGWKYEAHT